MQQLPLKNVGDSPHIGSYYKGRWQTACEKRFRFARRLAKNKETEFFRALSFEGRRKKACNQIKTNEVTQLVDLLSHLQGLKFSKRKDYSFKKRAVPAITSSAILVKQNYGKCGWLTGPVTGRKTGPVWSIKPRWTCKYRLNEF